jgi:hypothetical protein
LPIIRVTPGRLMRSSSARALGVVCPSRAIAASSEAREGESSSPACCRSRRPARPTATRRISAVPVGVSIEASIVTYGNKLSDVYAAGVAEAWIEVNLELAVERDRSVLVDLVDELAHGEDVVTWFFFWEPELRLRLRWGGEARRDAVRERLDRAVAEGLVLRWREERYDGEAEMYGAEAWPAIQKDWMNGSELALLFAKLERAGALTRTREFHWGRHVHLITNQLYGTWDEEVELCLAQAAGYLRHIVDGGGEASARASELIAELSDLASA